ncbi:MAG: inositol monophosphatase family protein [Thioalkalivibrionaceae bacterium]
MVRRLIGAHGSEANEARRGDRLDAHGAAVAGRRSDDSGAGRSGFDGGLWTGGVESDRHDVVVAVDAVKRVAREIARDVLLAGFLPDADGLAVGRGVERKPDGSLVTPTDLAVDRALRAALSPFGWPVLSEEQPAGTRAELRRRSAVYWLVDPLDGTSNFVAGLPFFALSIALVADNTVVAGITIDPWRDESFVALRGGALELNGAVVKPRRDAPAALTDAIGLVDSKRLAMDLRQRLFCQRSSADAESLHSMRNLGACALEWAWLAAGRADVYLHGGQASWDSAAGSVLLSAGGGLASDLAGQSVCVPSDEVKRSAIAARSPGLFEAWWAAVRG